MHKLFYLLFNYIHTTVLPDKCVEGGLIALTFDDGPTGATPEILDFLAEKDIPATFHFSTQNITRRNIQDIVIDTLDDRHEVGLRVNPQRNYDDMDTEDIKIDIENQVSALVTVTGRENKLKFARAPIEDGIANQNVYETLKDQELIQSSYSHCLYHLVDSPDEVEDTLRLLFTSSNVKYDSFIFLLHEQKELEFPTLETIVEVGEEFGYKFVSLNECLKDYEPGNLITKTGGQQQLRKKSAGKLFKKELSLLAMLLI